MKKLKPQTVDCAQIERFVANAEKKLTSAHKILAFDEEACLQQAYEAMLKDSLGFVFSHGFRARSQPGHHIATTSQSSISCGRGSKEARRSTLDLRPSQTKEKSSSV
jgi:hypothetical protein